MSGRPRVAEILLMRSVIPPQIPPTNMMCEKFGLFGTVGKFSIKSHSGGGREAGGGGSSLDGKLSRDPVVCACAEMPVSGATCAAALRLLCAHTQLIVSPPSGVLVQRRSRRTHIRTTRHGGTSWQARDFQGLHLSSRGADFHARTSCRSWYRKI